MAGRPKTREKAEKAEQRAQELESEVAELKKLLASVAPSLLSSKRPPAVDDYSAEICDRVLAYADQGMSEDEWINHLGLTRDEWDVWRNRYPEFRHTIELAQVRYVSWWQEKSRDAVNNNNSKFPTNVYNAVIRGATEREKGRATASGDASELVHIAIGEAARKMFGR